MPKKVKAVIKLNLPAGKANPAPPVGPALGQHGVAIMEFCRAYNEKTAHLGDTIIPAVITVFEDRSFAFVIKSPPASALLRKAAGLDKGAKATGREKIAQISFSQAQEIAKLKKDDLNVDDPQKAVKIIIGTARSMGIEVTHP